MVILGVVSLTAFDIPRKVSASCGSPAIFYLTLRGNRESHGKVLRKMWIGAQ